MIPNSIHRSFWTWLMASTLLGAGSAISATSAAPGSLAAPFRLRRWTTEDGLPKNTVTKLLQTRDGYLWVGTREGLARFNGVHFKVFTEELRIDAQGGRSKEAWPPEFSCQDLVEDSMGRVWVRLPDGLVCYDRGQFQKFSTRTGELATGIQTLIARRQGGLWIGTKESGLKRFEGGRYTGVYRTADGLATDFVGLLREDRDGRIWIGGGKSGSDQIISWQRLDPHSGEVVALATVVGQALPKVGNLQPDDRGRLWLSTPDELLLWEKGAVTRLANPGLPCGRDWTGDLTLADDGSFWIAPPLAGKLLRYRAGRFEQFDMNDGLADTDFRSLLWDREGNLWIGMGSGGLQRLRPGGLTSTLTTNANGSRLPVESISVGRQGAIWLGTWDGLLRWKNGQVECFTNDIPVVFPPSHNVRPVLEDRTGRVWFGFKDHGLFSLTNDRVIRVAAADEGRTNWTVRSLHEDRVGRLWIGTDTGLLVHHEGRFRRYTTRDGLLNDLILGIRDAPDGSLWVGTLSGLHHWRDGRFEALTVREGLLSDQATPLLVEEDGTIWAGTPLGLNRIRDREIRAVTERQGLSINALFSLLNDERGHYWASSVRGIVRMRRADLHAVADGRADRLVGVIHGEADGAASAEGVSGSQPNAGRTVEGRLWFATTRGAVVLEPAVLVQNEVAPPVVVEEVLADDRLIFADGGPTALGAKLSVTGAGVRLPPGRAQGLEIRYTANSFVAPEKVRFRYRLQGADSQWRDAQTRRVAFYTNLRPGAYEFRVEASNQEGLWSVQPAVFAFTLAPHFWQTWPFYVSCALGVVGLAAGIQSHRLRVQRRILKLQQQHAVEQERARIARDLHDDLGANLTGIALKADLAQRLAQAPQVAGQLAEIAASTRALVDDMRGTVWAMNPKHDTLEGLARFLAQQVEDFVANAGLRCRLELSGQFPELTVPSPTRYHLYLVVKEALHNVVKHAGASEIRLSLRIDEDALRLDLADDGRGFNPNSPQGSASSGLLLNNGGQGLPNMRQRVESLGGRWELRSSQDAGTSIGIRIPMHALRITPT